MTQASKSANKGAQEPKLKVNSRPYQARYLDKTWERLEVGGNGHFDNYSTPKRVHLMPELEDLGKGRQEWKFLSKNLNKKKKKWCHALIKEYPDNSRG